MSFVSRERASLIDTLARVGGDKPTLCDGWTTKDLLHHLLIREIQPLTALAAKLPIDQLSRSSKNRLAELEEASFDDLLARFRDGRQPYSPLRFNKVDSFMNTLEYAIHHEDVLRAQEPPIHRALTHEDNQVIHGALKVASKVLLRKVPVAVTLVCPGFDPIDVGSGTKKERGTVRIVGEPIDVLLYISGRSKAAQVTFEGDEELIGELTRTRLAM